MRVDMLNSEGGDEEEEDIDLALALLALLETLPTFSLPLVGRGPCSVLTLQSLFQDVLGSATAAEINLPWLPQAARSAAIHTSRIPAPAAHVERSKYNVLRYFNLILGKKFRTEILALSVVFLPSPPRKWKIFGVYLLSLCPCSSDVT